MLTCYLDESGTDNNSGVAVLGGFCMEMSGYFWLDVAWRKALAKHKIPGPLHMSEFGQDRSLSGVRSEERRALFRDLAKIINEHKKFSIASTLSSANYRNAFGGITEFSMYGASFIQVVMLIAEALSLAQNNEPVTYLLDCGNQYSKQISDGHDFITANQDKFRIKLGGLGFDSDDKFSVLQAADVVA